MQLLFYPPPPVLRNLLDGLAGGGAPSHELTSRVCRKWVAPISWLVTAGKPYVISLLHFSASGFCPPFPVVMTIPPTYKPATAATNLPEGTHPYVSRVSDGCPQ